MISSELAQFIMLIVAVVVSITLCVVVLIKAIKEGFTRRRIAVFVLALGLLFIVYLAYNRREIQPADWAQIMLVLSLVAVTGLYALSAARQADASVKMAKEMREQRIMASRPVIIQKTVYEESGFTDSEMQFLDIEESTASYFSHFEIYNAGSGPAVEVEISLTDKKGSPSHSIRQTFLRAGEPPIQFSPYNIANLDESIAYYIVCEYQSIFSRETWYQTWLPFELAKSSKEAKVFIVAGKLEFREVTEKHRVDAFSSRSKPK